MYLICLKENISEMYVRKWWLYCTYPAVYCIALSCHAPSSWTATDKYNRALIIWQKIIVAYDTVRNYFQMCWWWVQGISFLKLSGNPEFWQSVIKTVRVRLLYRWFAAKVLCPQNQFSRKLQRYKRHRSCYVDIRHLCFWQRHVL